MSRLRVIKEPIHNYIPVSKLENDLINDPLFLRLQHISQNGLAYLTYPNNRTSRFLHSLGTMHIGGDMLLQALSCSDGTVRRKFLAAFNSSLKEAYNDQAIRSDQIFEILKSQNDILYRHKGLDPEKKSDQVSIVLFQSIRIACVLHDIGHPPFSHTLESVLQGTLDSLPLSGMNSEQKAFQQLATLGGVGGGDLHELMGQELTRFVFSNFRGRQRDFAKFCFWIAQRIAKPEIVDGGPEGVYSCLHSIVSGEVDADRCDYVLRDGYASSFEFGNYDLARIMHNIRLHKF